MSAVAGRNTVTVPMCIRAIRLKNRGLSYPAIAAVLSEDYGVEILGEQVRYKLRHQFDVPPDRSRVRTPPRKAAA